MNPLELRHEIHNGLVNRNRPPTLISAEKLSPVPGEPVALEVVTQDPFSHPGAIRRYRITVEEIT